MDSELVDKLLPDTDRYDHAQKCKKFMSLRFLVAFVSLLGCAVMYMTRVNINVAIVDMVTVVPKISAINTAVNQSVLSDECPVDSLNSDNTTIVGEFNWSPPTQGIVLGAFYYGYIWPQIFGGRLSELYGAKYMIGIAIFTSGVINLFTPFIIRCNYYLFIGSRVVLGLVQGILFPSFMVLMSKWIPPEEHSTFIPWLDVGCTIGTIVCSAGAGHLIENKVMGGWPSVFYICGVVAIVWCFLWFSVITSSPSSHSWITDIELNHILKRADNRRQNKTRDSIPWKRILTSKRFLSVLISKVLFGITWDFITSKIPAYFQDVIHFPISENGSIYSILMLGLAITSMSSGFVADMILETKWISKTNVRKLFQTIAGVGMAVALVMTTFAGCDKLMNITLLTVCMLVMGITSGGDVPIVADMTETYTGTVFAIMNSIGSIGGFIVPYFVGVAIDSNPNSMQTWSHLFYFAATLDIIGVIVFMSYSSAEPQHWESIDETNDDYTIDYTILFDQKHIKKNLHKYSL